jgi:lipoprotein-anchoring transpeptidase ErfK/SrfK
MLRSFLFVALAASVLTAPAQAAVLVTIDKSVQQMTVSVDGRPLYQWPVSTGKAGYDTPNGKFKAFRMERDHYSKEWDEAPMPFSIFFTQKGHAIHGSLDMKRLVSPASHGCVRLLPANAEKLFTLVEQEGVLNTTVVLTGVAPSSAPAVARRAPRPDAEQANAQPQYGQPQYGQPQYGQPQYQQPYQQQYGQLPRPAYGQQQPVYGNPYYGQQQNAQPQYSQPYGAPRAYIYRDSYDEPYQTRPRTLFPF